MFSHSNGHPSDPAPESQVPSPEPPARDRHLTARIVAVIEIVLCSDVVTQLAIGGTLAAMGMRPRADGRLSVGYVVALSLGDAVLLIGLILAMLYAHGERPADVFFGRRNAAREGALGSLLIPASIVLAAVVLLTVRRFAPSLHDVEHNPLQDMLTSPRDAWWFALVVLVAGGVREEIQRAFLLHRFEVWLGGRATGLIVTSLAFGAAHYGVQGIDAGIATGLLGAFWGLIYLWRRSSIAPIVSHAGFDLLQVVPFLGLR